VVVRRLVRCPVTIGRGEELAALQAAVTGAADSRSSTVAVLGEPGIGKTRMVRDTADCARAAGLRVLEGRCVQTGSGTAFRPVAEILLAGLRDSGEPHDPGLDGFLPVLGRLVPQWRRPLAASDDSHAILAEGVLRLLTTFAGKQGLLVVVEDLHWADVETLAVLEYLADNLDRRRLLLLVTARDEPGAARRVLHALEARRRASVLILRPLQDAELAAMASACLSAPASEDLLDVVCRRSGGTPLLVEELVAAGDQVASVIPVAVEELVWTRLAALARDVRRCLEAAAVLGATFDWSLLPRVLTVSPDAVMDWLGDAVDAGVVDVTADGGFRFHHVLGRDAVLARILPPLRHRWALAALDALVDTHGERMDSDTLALAADLALQAGDRIRAAAALVRAGRSNLANGALASAEAVLERARDLAGDDPVAGDADEVLAEVLAQAGKTDAALAASVRCVERWRGTPEADQALARTHIRFARISVTAGNWTEADAHLTTARAHAADPETRLAIAAATATAALGAGRFEEACTLAEQALADAQRRDLPEVTCEALTVLGRLARRGDLAASERYLIQARAVADEAGLVVAAARAVEELAIGDVTESLRVDRIAAARRTALEVGDLFTVAVLDLQATATYTLRWQPQEAIAAGDRCITASRRFGFVTLAKALVLRAAANHLGPDVDCEADLAEALDLAPEDTHLLGEVWGVRAMRALTATDDQTALAHLDRAMDAFQRRPTEVTASPALGLWTLLTLACDTTASAPHPLPEPVTGRWTRGLLGYAEAVARGRRGDPDGATAAFASADTVLATPVPVSWLRLQGRRITARAAITDGWGAPAEWLTDDLVVLEARGEPRWTATTRSLLRRAGAPVPRRLRNGDLPRELAALGITAREADVLRLVAEGRSNTEIAEQLVLSPRTVEKHIERLLAKTQTGRRPRLVAFAARLAATQ
jgi:DNA-binding CsgD family transcriptional regulator/tetratricopeptide (TPR) repeat protein